uniref:Uncharacterized protein n=1 Tax=Kuenenia stuttgartiensis TaxID=174633 RepID=Q1PWR4_KUEST|nr:unknown protein [Candidatus Kuenenia stuttgartiensis]
MRQQSSFDPVCPAWERNCVGSSSFHLASKRSFAYYSVQKRSPNILGNILKSLQADIMGSFPFPFEAGASQTIPFPNRSLGTSGFFHRTKVLQSFVKKQNV